MGYVKILGEAVAPGQATPVANLVVATPKAVNAGKMPVGIGNVALGAGVGYAGYRLWKKHPILGALAGLSIGFNGLDVVHSGSAARKDALIGMGVTGAAVGGALAWKKHPALGFTLTAVAVSVLTSYIPGSPMQRLIVEGHKERLADAQAKRLGLPATAAAATPPPAAARAA